MIIGQKFEIMLDIVSVFWEIWLDIVSSTSFFGAFRAHFRIKITLFISQKHRNSVDIIVKSMRDKIRKVRGILLGT